MATADEDQGLAQAEPDRPLGVLVRYSGSPKDTELVRELLQHLQLLERFAGIEVWTDRIRPGDETRQEIDDAVQRATVALLLLSPDLLASKTFEDIEIPQLRARHASGNLKVIPIVLRSCLWDAHPWMSNLHPVPSDRIPIAAIEGDKRDRVITDVVRDIMGLAAPLVTSAGPGNTNTASVNAQAATTAPATSAGATFHVNIQGSAIGGMSFGDHARADGLVDVSQIVDQRSPSAADERAHRKPVLISTQGSFATSQPTPDLAKPNVGIASNVERQHLSKHFVDWLRSKLNVRPADILVIVVLTCVTFFVAGFFLAVGVFVAACVLRALLGRPLLESAAATHPAAGFIGFFCCILALVVIRPIRCLSEELHPTAQTATRPDAAQSLTPAPSDGGANPGVGVGGDGCSFITSAPCPPRSGGHGAPIPGWPFLSQTGCMCGAKPRKSKDWGCLVRSFTRTRKDLWIAL
jgi:hypothetical protein